MALELLFTSATQGLKPGSQGYCTVQCTQAMPGPLAERLEALSAYRPVYPSQSEQAKLNPVNVAYWRIRLMGKTFPVLSRIADYGLDYSNRTNKIAHHLVIDPSELSDAGPAAIAASGNALLTEWNQKVEAIAQPRRLPVVSSPSGICRHWQDTMGDAGWAGVIAEEIMKDQKQPIFLIFEPGQKMLPLIVEVQSLLPPNLRWKSTFSTYLTYLPPEAECQIRCLLKGSKEAHESLRHVNSRRIDLTQPTPTQSSPLVDAARTGVMPVRARKPESDVSYDFEIDDDLPDERNVASRKHLPAAEPLQFQQDEGSRHKPGLRRRQKNYNAAPVLPSARRKRLAIAGGLVGVLLCAILAVVMLPAGKEKPQEVAEKTVPVETPVVSLPVASVAGLSEAVGSIHVETPPQQSIAKETKSNLAGNPPQPSTMSSLDNGQNSNTVTPVPNNGETSQDNLGGAKEKQPKIVYLTDLLALSESQIEAGSPAKLETEVDITPKSLRLIYPEKLLATNTLMGLTFGEKKLEGRIYFLDEKGNKTTNNSALFELNLIPDGVEFKWIKGFYKDYNTPAILAFSILEIDSEQQIYLSLHKKRRALLKSFIGINPETEAYAVDSVDKLIVPEGSQWTGIERSNLAAKDVVVTFQGNHNQSIPVFLKRKSVVDDHIEFVFQSEKINIIESIVTAEYASPNKPNEVVRSFASDPLAPISFTVKYWLDRVVLDFEYDSFHKQINKAESFIEAVKKPMPQESDAFRDAKKESIEAVEAYLAKLRKFRNVPIAITGRIEYSLEDVERGIMIPVVLVEFVKEPNQ